MISTQLMRQSSRNFIVMFQAALFFMALAPIPAYSLQARETGTPISVRSAPGFENPEQLLQDLVQARSRLPVHHFCVVGYENAGSDTIAWAHWVEGKALILWEPTSESPLPLIASRRFLNLQRDVVASEKDLKGSTYLVTRTWVDAVLADCARVGDQYVIHRVYQPNKR